MPNQINIKLNHLDEDGNVVDSDNMDLTQSQVSDIVDHASSLVIQMRKHVGVNADLSVISAFRELEEALIVSGVLDEG